MVILFPREYFRAGLSGAEGATSWKPDEDGGSVASLPFRRQLMVTPRRWWISEILIKHNEKIDTFEEGGMPDVIRKLICLHLLGTNGEIQLSCARL